MILKMKVRILAGNTTPAFRPTALALSREDPAVTNQHQPTERNAGGFVGSSAELASRDLRTQRHDQSTSARISPTDSKPQRTQNRLRAQLP
jgi:hypothetical protein